MTSTQQSLIDDLERAISAGTIGDRAAMLRRVTDLFLVVSGNLSDAQVNLFDAVMSRLLDEIEVSARATFAHLLATRPDAPAGIARTLALDDAIDVADSVLTHSTRVDESTLIEGASTKSQAHLLAISRRQALSEAVTDVLVERGDREVVSSTAKNTGAAFSEFGYATLVERSLSDDDLAACVWARPEIPRQHLLRLFVDASEALKAKLTKLKPGRANFVLEIVAQASLQIQAKARERSPDYAAAYAYVQSLHAEGRLGESQVAAFAERGKFDQTTVALSFICDLPISLTERALVEEGPEQIILLAKAAGFSWNVVKPILLLQSQAREELPPKLEPCFETFTRLRTETAKTALEFYRLRNQAALMLRSP